MKQKNQINEIQPRKINGHRLSEFVYGIVTSMVAVSGISISQGISWVEVALIIVVGASAIWIAHAYSTLLGDRIASGRRLTGRDIAHALYNSWPIVTAGILLASPMIATALGFLPIESSLRMSGILGLVLLGIVGFLAGVVTRESWPRRIIILAATVGIGILVISFELLIHH